MRIIKKVGKFLKANFAKHRTLTQQRGTVKETVTRYDKLADRMIIKEIRKHYPSHNILTEESGFFDNKSQYTWIVDSLDGTSNFASSNPLFATSIALSRLPSLGKDEQIILGIIFSPITRELFVAAKGKGAFLNGKSIKVSDVDKLSQSYILVCEGGERKRSRPAQIYKKLLPKTKDTRKLGSAALECAYVASGRFDGYATTKIEPWDIAAGALLVEEAGGKMSDFRGRKWNFSARGGSAMGGKTDLIFSNSKIHSALVKMLKSI